MLIHHLLAERLTTRFGVPERVLQQHSWHVDVHSTRVNIVLDLPSETNRARVWVFDPRRMGDESAKHFCVDSPEQIDGIVAEVVQRATSGLARQAGNG